MTLLHKFTPRMPKKGLLFVAGLVWGAAGTILFYRGTLFLLENSHHVFVRFVGGIIGGILFFYVLFRKISHKHATRIRNLEPERPCLFAFLDWRGYVLMGLMICLGVAVRTYQIVPATNLGTLYIAMGTPLLFSSARFIHGGVNYS